MLLLATPCLGHTFSFTDTTVVFAHDGTYLIDMTLDLDALALGAPPTREAGEVVAELKALGPAELEQRVAELREFLLKRIWLQFDGQRVTPVLSFPQRETPLAAQSPVPTVLGTTLRLEGRVPQGAREFVFRAGGNFPPVRLMIVKYDREEVFREVLGKGVESRPYDLARVVAPRTSWQVAWEYLRLGYEHILPDGVDHILFVLGLFLLNTSLRALLWQVTAFTVAHSITLALAMTGVFTLDARVVEPLIALSIAYVAIENLLTRRLHWWRTGVVFLFGLLHGMGFAGAVATDRPPSGALAAAIVSFNVGVELGQISVILLALLATLAFRKRSWYRAGVVVPASCLIATVGLYWTVQRVFFT